jgi:uncharacterized membrane protein
MSFSDPHHPVWGLARVCVVCVSLLTLQLLTATNYDVALDGEAGTLAGVALTSVVVEFLRRKP